MIVCISDFDQSHRCVGVMFVVSSLLLWILQVGCGTPVDVGSHKLAMSDIHVGRLHVLVSLFHTLNKSNKKSAITIEPKKLL